jgi:hypothetical protein
MAYVPDFTWDIFLSFPMEGEEWVKQFDKELRKKIGEKVQPYFAKRSWELGQISEDMLEAARESALFVAVLTQSSLEDERRFLRQELEAFRKSGPVEGRFCPIPLKPVKCEHLAKLMPLQQGGFWNKISFYYEEDGIPITLTPETEERKGDYMRAVEKVAWQLKKRLDEVKRSKSGGVENEGRLGAGKRVLLAEEEMNIRSEWTKVRNLLRNDGATILPSEKYPENDAEYEKAFKADLEQADLFVQLLSPLDEVKHFLESAGNPSRAERAAVLAYDAAATRNLPILQWRKYSSNVLRPWNSKLLDGDYVVVTGLEEFIREIRMNLENKPPNSGEITAKPYLYITADKLDLILARELQKTARKSVDAVVMTETESERKEQFDEVMSFAAAVIFLYGTAPRTFVDRWLAHYISRIHLQKYRPRLQVLYQAPPKKTNDEEPLNQFDGLRLLGSQDEFTLKGVQQICEELRDDAAG